MTQRLWRKIVLVGFAGLVVVSQRGPALAGNHPAATDAIADDLGDLLSRVGERVVSYYDRVSTIFCTETVTQNELKRNMTPQGKPRRFVYDLIITRDPVRPGDTTVQIKAERRLTLIDGRPPRKRDRPGCTDPKPVYGDPLTFLLPENRSGYRFTPASTTDPASRVLDFVQLKADPTKVKWEDNCFSADGGRASGRIWVDPATDDVLRLETRLAEPFRLVVSPALTSGLRRFMTIERSDTVVRFRRVPFQDPDETLLLPDSIVTITSVPGAVTPRLRTEQTFTNFQRFMTEAKVKGVG